MPKRKKQTRYNLRIQKKKKKPCVKCGNDVGGRVENVKPTICCVDCCTEKQLPFSSQLGGHYCVTAQQAKMVYGCRPQELKSIKCDRSIRWGEKRTSRFLLAEVEYIDQQFKHSRHAQCLPHTLAHRVKDMIEKRRKDEDVYVQRQDLKRRQWERIEMRERKELNRKKIKLADMKIMDEDPVLCHFLVGDYLKSPFGSRMKDPDIDKRCAVFERTKEILKSCKGAHPEAVIDFCLENKEGGPREFAELKEKMKAVFHLEGFRIFHFVEQVGKPAFRKRCFRLYGTPLEADYDRFKKRDSDAILRGHLRRWFDSEAVNFIMGSPHIVEVLQDGSEDTMAEKLFRGQTGRSQREQELDDALKARNLHRPQNCLWCLRYMFGMEKDLKGIVGIVELKHRIAEQHICLDVLSTNTCIDRFYCLLESGGTYESALRTSMAYARKLGKTCNQDLSFVALFLDD